MGSNKHNIINAEQAKERNEASKIVLTKQEVTFVEGNTY